MKYTPTQLQSMASTLLLAQEIGDPRWNHFVSELSKRTGVPEGGIFQIVEALAKDALRKNTRH